MQMPFTGERYVPELRGQIYYEHLHRYALAVPLARDADVLDIASGEGYGAAYLATTARSVVGVDIDPDSVRHAASRYAAMNLSFRVGSCTQIPLGDRSVDTVISFETLEHIQEHEQFMREIVRVLRPGGRLLISSPNRLVYSDAASYPNPFHVKELYFNEFRELLSNWFPNVRIFGQRIFAASAVHPLLGAAAAMRCVGPSARAGDDGLPALSSPTYFLAACSLAESGDELQHFESIFLDTQDDLLDHILHPMPLLPDDHGHGAPLALAGASPALEGGRRQPALSSASDGRGQDDRARLQASLGNLLRSILGDDYALESPADAIPEAQERLLEANAAYERAIAELREAEARSRDEDRVDRALVEQLLHTVLGEDAETEPRSVAIPKAQARLRTANAAYEEAVAERALDVRLMAELIEATTRGSVEETSTDSTPAVTRERVRAAVERLIRERAAAADLLSLIQETLLDEMRLRPEDFAAAHERVRADREQLAGVRDRFRALERKFAGAELHVRSLEERIGEKSALEGQIRDLHARVAAEVARADAASQMLAQTRAALDDLVRSRSWKMTKPVRVAMGALRRR